MHPITFSHKGLDLEIYQFLFEKNFFVCYNDCLSIINSSRCTHNMNINVFDFTHIFLQILVNSSTWSPLFSQMMLQLICWHIKLFFLFFWLDSLTLVLFWCDILLWKETRIQRKNRIEFPRDQVQKSMFCYFRKKLFIFSVVFSLLNKKLIFSFSYWIKIIL